MEMIHQLYRDTSGATMVEYSLMIAFIALACFTTVQSLGVSVQKPFTDASTGFGGSEKIRNGSEETLPFADRKNQQVMARHKPLPGHGLT